MAQPGIVEYFGEHEKYSCGYCKSSDTSYSHGMWGHSLTPIDYQNLIDRGWRRSGKYCYKPTMHRTCCPQYAIRCEVLNFKLTRSQKKVLKRMKKFLTSGLTQNADSDRDSLSEAKEVQEQNMDLVSSDFVHAKRKAYGEKDVSAFLENHGKSKIQKNKTSDPGKVPTSPASVPSTSADSIVYCGEGEGMNSERPKCKKAKVRRRERRVQKLLNAGFNSEEALLNAKKPKCSEKTLEDFISDVPSYDNLKHRLELRLVPCVQDDPDFSKTFEESYRVYQKYQVTIHKDPPYKCSKKQYTRFLVNNPFQRGSNQSSDNVHGSYHQQYWLDDKLIAVGVLDILPYCVSSVYLYYDPDYSFLSMGTYSSLREIAFTRELHQRHSDLKYYYMGFYIHTCPKMQYKGSYSPSFLLCPEMYVFQPIEKCIPKLDDSKYHRLDEDSEKVDDDIVKHEEVMVVYNSRAMDYAMYRVLNKHADDEQVVQEYANLVGRKCYQQILLYRA